MKEAGELSVIDEVLTGGAERRLGLVGARSEMRNPTLFEGGRLR